MKGQLDSCPHLLLPSCCVMSILFLMSSPSQDFALQQSPRQLGKGPWPETPESESVLLFCYCNGKLINVKPRRVFVV